MKLPPPRLDGPCSLEQTIQKRRSVRNYTNAPLDLEHLAQLLWAAQGITNPLGLRTAPSARATYPLELFVAASNVSGLEAGTYQYKCQNHEISLIASGNPQQTLTNAALGQTSVATAPLSLIIAAVPLRTAQRCGEHAARYVAMEAGHVAQNIYLQATALGLGTLVVAAFIESEVNHTMGLGEAQPFYIMPVGKTES
jgi:SagB-type dehydrogenase family enzyme